MCFLRSQKKKTMREAVDVVAEFFITNASSLMD
jgi:hypothetical protein